MVSDLDKPTYLKSLALEVIAKYRRLDSVLSHAPTKGTYHENIIRNLIRDYLPNSYSTGEGFIINSEAITSSQLDVLIVDNVDPRSFGYKEDNFFIASDIAVTTYGEVKTYCGKNEFRDAFKKLVDTSLIIGEPGRVTSFLFCYDARASAETLKKWVDELKDSFETNDDLRVFNLPDYIFCLKKNIMFELKPVSQDGRIFRYWNATTKNIRSTELQEKMISDLLSCVTNGCGRMKIRQGITLLKD